MIYTTNVIDAIDMLPIDTPDELLPALLAEHSRRYEPRAYF